ncbi:hypothetical protein [Streptomyces europaeiscabiei]|uniref:hypothetical protein n=2 Tax=Streptomyces europaeiscabiei TaxID=146819 RepID=UPI002E1830DC
MSGGHSPSTASGSRSGRKPPGGDLTALAEEIKRYCARPDAGFVRASHVSNARRRMPMEQLAGIYQKACLTRLHGVHVLLFNIGQVPEPPFHGLKTAELWRTELTPPETPPALAAPVSRWLSGRLQTSDRAESVRHSRDAFRYFLRWLAQAHPDIDAMTQLERRHVEGFIAHMHEHINARTGRPLTARSRYTQLAEGGAQIQTIMGILGHRNAQMSATYSHISDPVLKEQYEKVIAAGGRIAGPAAEELLTSRIGEDTLNWLKTNFFKTELELGHCLRAPAEGPCECDLYLRCSQFLTTSEYAPRLRSRLAREQQLAQDAVERGWPREVERHKAIAERICGLLADLGESAEPGPDDHC